MAKATVTVIAVKHKSVDFDLFSLASMQAGSQDAWKIKFDANGNGAVRVDAPGKYMLTWYVSGPAGGYLKAKVFVGGKLIASLSKKETLIPDREKENYGLIEIEVE